MHSRSSLAIKTTMTSITRPRYVINTSFFPILILLRHW
nr:MAG TPA: hypothetical protein [Bacteriophage sp.]